MYSLEIAIPGGNQDINMIKYNVLKTLSISFSTQFGPSHFIIE